MREVQRVIYDGDGLSEADLAPTPWAQLSDWLDAAVAASQERADVPEPTAMSVATVDADGHPDVRVVLMRFLDERGPGFATTLDSTKGSQLAANPWAAATLAWPTLFRAVRFRGRVELVEREAVTAYFQTRPWDSRVSAWASHQSRPVDSRHALQEAYDAAAQRFPDTGSPDDVPVPETWGAYRIRPVEVEFWAGRRGRLHDRLVFVARSGEPGGLLDDASAWSVQRRQP